MLETLQSIDAHPNISWKLPKQKTAGGILSHAVACMETLHAKFYPFIFKIGITQNAANRWDSPRFGYKFERDKWESMLVIFLGPEQFTPAMLEAALIDKYRRS